MKVTVTIASTGRATLARTLASLGDIHLPPDCVLDIVIADDSRNGAVRRIVEAGAPWRHPIRCLAVGAGNVSMARNACLEVALGDLIAFVDDDEWVAADWLLRLLAAMEEFAADCVFGPVHPVYPPGTPDWIRTANPLYTDWGPRGRIVDIGRCGNTLLKRSAIDRQRLRFDHRLGKTGGEDTDFFHRLARSGARMVVTDDAMVHEDAPPQRLTLSHFRERAIRKGQIYARFRTSQPGVGRLAATAFYLGAAGKTLVALTGAGALAVIDPARALRLAMRGWMNLGKLREAIRIQPPQWT
jgi:succinoglycan biosynthesis protein ExoM